MKFESTKERLKEAISLAERATGKNLTLPILGSILLEAKDRVLKIKATNLDVGLEIEVPAKISEEGSVAVNAQILSGFLNNLNKEDRISAEAVNNNLHLATDHSSTLIKCFPADDFPVIPRVESLKPSRLLASELVDGLKAVIYSASLSDIKPEISSVYIYIDQGELVFVATDSFRLAEKRLALSGKVNDFSPVILPYKNVGELIRVFDGADLEVRIDSNQNQISFYSDTIHFTSRVIDGVYPDYRQIMPKSFKTEVSVKKEDIANALKLASIFADKFNQLVIKINPRENIFEINSRNQDVGENTVTVSATMEGEEIEMSFNGRYIIDSFSSIASDTILFRFNEKNRPLLLMGLGDTSFSYIVMPINR